MIDFSVYLVTGKITETTFDTIKEALDGGIRAIQLRDAGMPENAFMKTAEGLRELTKKYSAKLFLNSKIEIAQGIGADGIHFKSNMLNDGTILNQIGSLKKKFIICFSAHNVNEAVNAEKAGADFIVSGTLFPSASKSGNVTLLGIDGLKEIIKNVHIPVFAIGGINDENSQDILKTNAKGIAIISYIFNAKNPKENAEKLIGTWGRGGNFL